MAKYKVLKSVAHNLGHSFTSLMNYSVDDYALGHILRFARQTGRDTLTIDLITAEAGPPELLQEPVSYLPERYASWFSRLVETHGSDRSLIDSATLTLRYDLAVQRLHSPTHSGSEFIESPYACEVVIKDNRGKIYSAHFKGWWFPERMEPIKNEPRRWWKFWHPRGTKN
jgi:hypothetical protein